MESDIEKRNKCMADIGIVRYSYGVCRIQNLLKKQQFVLSKCGFALSLVTNLPLPVTNKSKPIYLLFSVRILRSQNYT